ncbi:hypothetical protein EJ04DRAFT_515082 [Polyplosphaeria fusca]|uniref:Uncharacterized protein n=1 Tax=Polyplosphaeria fusca TaxID=682080 RepID=A0A9P4UZ72_9PLEO|nr:hypothetical protein EJ04DRAFT_515082 [Polyplosphaeria fusca]
MDEPFFRHFSFAEAMRRPASVVEAERTASNISPTTVPARLPTPPCSMGELEYRFHRHTLRIDPSLARPACYAVEPLTPPGDDAPLSPDQSLASQQRAYASLSAASLRRQRQAHMRMQCSSSHVKDISNLVQKMVEDGDQCHVCDPKSRTTSRSSSPSSHSYDEGVVMDYSPPSPGEEPLHTLKFRRSGDQIVGHATVSKSIRMRKKSRVMKRSSR